jgi:DNA (cytosine-5)-methyltransferase 1
MCCRIRRAIGMRIGVVDLFCGIGGLSYGFKSEGFDVIAGIDSDSSCSYAYEANVKANFIEADIAGVKKRDIVNLFKRRPLSYRVLVGCAPCTPFSIYVGRYRKKRRRSADWHLLNEFSRLVRQTKPDVISMENVPRLIRHRIFSKFVRDIENIGYTVTYQTVRAEHYGVPQRRARLVLFASLWGEVKLVSATHLDNPKTVRDAIGRLPKIKPGQPCQSDRVHVTRNLTERNVIRLRSTTEGGSWKDWDKTLQLACHRKKGGKTFRSVYGRMRWDAPSPVITTQCLGIGNGRFGHPEQDRAISIREAALLQSFPKRFRLLPPRKPINGVRLARHIGNAVPVRLGRAIARSIKRHLADVSG